MRTLLVFVLILAVVAGAIGVYLFATTPKESAGVTFPLTADQRALLARVPAGADSFALLPTAGLLATKLRANPVTREPFEQWTATQELPQPWMLGGADIVVWRNGKQTSYAIRVDTVRAFLLRTWMQWTSDLDARWDGTAFVINGGGAAMPAAAMDDILRTASGLPPGDVLMVQVDRTRGVFPPIGRPAVTTVRITAEEIVTVSRAKSEAQAPAGEINARFPKGAMLAATFAAPPRILGDLQRLLGTNITGAVSDGGSIALYDVDAGTLLPRPKGLISVPSTPERRAALADVIRAAELVGETRDTGQELLVAFDRKSVPLYLKDAFVPATWPATSWAVRLDPSKLVPVLQKLGDSTGLRLASGRLHRAARDLRRWIGSLEQAESIEAAASTVPAASGAERFDELRVRIASK